MIASLVPRSQCMSGFIYIMTNKNNTVLYVGATDDIKRRVMEHKLKIYPKSFTAKYSCNKLVYFEEYPKVNTAFAREQQLKAGNRRRKERLINNMNPGWNDLSLNGVNKNFGLRPNP